MPIIIAWGNIQDSYPLNTLPETLRNNKEQRAFNNLNPRVKRRQRSRQVAHFLLWQSLLHCGQDPNLLAQIATTASGRPYFPVANIDFNISHSGDWVAIILNVAAAPNAVGIDIEAPEKERNFAKLLRHFASIEEQQWFAQQPFSDLAFYQIWCTREAMLKAQGVGIVKLSEVRHNPLLFEFQTDYCPQGKLLFSAEQPFFLAAFAAAEHLRQVEFLCWNGERLQPTTLNQHLQFKVNY